MKSCNYYYKGHLIGDVRQLDDFLLEKQKFEPELGDMVFQLTTPQLEAQSRLKLARREKDELDKAYNKAKEEARKAGLYGADEEAMLKMERPYVGVSEFLSGQRNFEGKLYFPEFIAQNYWSERYYEWSKGNFTDDEIELFFEGDKSKIVAIPIGNTNDWRDENGIFKEKFGTEEQARLRDLMQEKWENQAKYGNEVHSILQLYFSLTDNNKWSDLLEGPQAGMHKAKFIEKLRKKELITDITTDKIINETLEYAKNLKKNLERKYRDRSNPNGELLFYPEVTLSADLNKEYENRNDLKLLGRVDLLVIDESGTPHVIDYKTSPKPYEQYSTAKQLNFTYQLATYERMLRRWGFNTTESDISVAPIQLNDFKKIDGNWQYSGITKGTIETSPLKDLTPKLAETYLNNNLNEYIEAPLTLGLTTENIISEVSKVMKVLFPKYGESKRTDKEIRELINEQKGFELNKETGRYEYTPKGFKTPIYATEKEGEEMLFKRVKDFYEGNKEKAIRNASTIKKALKKVQSGEDGLVLPAEMDEWVSRTLSKYANNNWAVVEGPVGEAALQFGVLLIQDITTDLVEVVKISSNDPKYMHNWGTNRTNLTGAHEIDITEDSRSDSLILKAANGNIELIETMLVLNNMTHNKPMQLGKIQVITPWGEARGLSASNKELDYNWKKMMQIARKEKLEITDNYRKGGIKLLSNVEQCFQEFQEILRRANSSQRSTDEKYKKLEPMINKLESVININNIEEQLILLNELREKLEKDFGMNKDIDNEKRSIHSGVKNYDDNYTQILYQMVAKSILELNKFNVRQALHDHDHWMQTFDILNKGFSGSYVDNAGNFGLQMLNQISALALEGYQNARDLARPKLRKLRDMVESIKHDEGYSGIVEHTIGNQTSLYNGMTYFDKNGDLLFINPWKDTHGLSAKKVELLKYVITEINKNKHPDWSEQQLQDKINSNDLDFFRVPLIEGTFASKVNTDGWLGWIKKRLKMFSSFATLKQYLRDKQSEFLSESEEEYAKVNKEIFDVVNLMEQGNDDKRIDIINQKRREYGDGFFERDLERILSTHIWSYSTSDALKDRMPLIKSAFISLSVMGNEQNYNFTKDEQFLREFVANKINHQSIVDDKFKTPKAALGIVQRIASWMALAFSPVQMSYQTLEGIWKDAKLIITKPDGTETFSLENMKRSAKTVYKELYHFDDKDSVTTAVNALYGINDMDNVAFADNNTSNKHGMFNFFGKLAYKFSSRPDFYNRMTIFVAQMMQDGSWEAHSIDPKTNELKYNWTKDKRFAAYAKDKEGKNGKTEEWHKAKSLYYATAQQLVREGARKKDGTLFKVGDPLPKAYSNKESEAKKAVGDTMYGYYDSTKKSLMQSTMLGGLLMQMRTYWSAKKNQYLAPGGIKSQGEWVHAEQEFINPETGEPEKKKMYYAKLENGELDINGPLVPEGDPTCSDTPFLQWKGKFEEGVLVTVWGLLKSAHNKSWKEGWNDYWNNQDENLRKAYQSNIKLLVCDLIMWALIGGAATLLGDWSDDEQKEAKKSGHFEDAAYAAWVGLIHKTVYNSSLDFAWWNSIFEISMDWNPMAIAYVGNEAKAIGNFVTGDASFADTIVKSFSAARQVRPIFTFLDQEEE